MALLLVLFVFITAWFGIIDIAKLIRGEAIPWLNIFFLAVGLTGIATHYMGVW